MPAWVAPVVAAVAGAVANKVLKSDDPSGGSSETTTTYPPHVTRMQQDAFGIARDLGSQPYVAPPFDTVAPMSGYTTAALEDTVSSQGNWRPGMQGAFATTGDVIDQSNDRNTYTPASWNSQMARRYMSPYVKGALDPVAREMREEYGRQGVALQSNAASEGALGGSRQALLEAEHNYNRGQSISDLYAQGYDRAYGSALGAFGRDADRGLNTARLNETVRSQDLTRMLSGGDLLSRLSGRVQDMSGEDINRMVRAGALDQGQQQSEINEAYRQWTEQRDWGERALNYYLSALGQGGPVGSNKETELTARPTHIGSQLAGAGLAAYGLYKDSQDSGSGSDSWNTGQYFSGSTPVGQSAPAFEFTDFSGSAQ